MRGERTSTFELWQQSKSVKLQTDIFYKKNQLAYDKTFCLTFQHVIWHSVWSALSNNLQLHPEAVCWNNSILSKTNICLFKQRKVTSVQMDHLLLGWMSTFKSKNIESIFSACCLVHVCFL